MKKEEEIIIELPIHKEFYEKLEELRKGTGYRTLEDMIKDILWTAAWKEEKVKINVSVTRGMYEKLEELRRQEGKMSIPELIREALKEYIDRRVSEINWEIKRELEYLEAQRKLGQKMHHRIAESLERLRKLGYPPEKIDEIRKWFY